MTHLSPGGKDCAGSRSGCAEHSLVMRSNAAPSLHYVLILMATDSSVIVSTPIYCRGRSKRILGAGISPITFLSARFRRLSPSPETAPHSSFNPCTNAPFNRSFFTDCDHHCQKGSMTPQLVRSFLRTGQSTTYRYSALGEFLLLDAASLDAVCPVVEPQKILRHSSYGLGGGCWVWQLEGGSSAW